MLKFYSPIVIACSVAILLTLIGEPFVGIALAFLSIMAHLFHEVKDYDDTGISRKINAVEEYSRTVNNNTRQLVDQNNADMKNLLFEIGKRIHLLETANPQERKDIFG